MTLLRIAPIPGFTPTVGRLVSMLAYARESLLEAVEGLSRGELDLLHDSSSNSIGALLAHAAAVERWYQIFTFEAREPSPIEIAPWAAALDLGAEGRRELVGRELPSYLDELAVIRRQTLSALAERDDVWLEAPLLVAPDMNAHWAWFHVAEDEINHRGQIRWLRARLRPAGARVIVLIEIRTDDPAFTTDAFLTLAQRVWPRSYDRDRTEAALTRSVNVGAWDGERLVGAVRLLSDGYLFACVSEILVDPDYQRRGLGRRLMDAALATAPRGKLFLGAQPEAVGFFERLGYTRGPVGFVAARVGGAGGGKG